MENYMNKVDFDFWYGHKLEDVTRITVSFSDCDCIYRGWMYKGTQVIGDYHTSDSVALEKAFRQIGIEVFND